jgi:hypothetical protein
MDRTIRTTLHSWKDRKLPHVMPRDIDLDGYLGMKPIKNINPDRYTLEGIALSRKHENIYDSTALFYGSQGTEYLDVEDDGGGVGIQATTIS